MTSAVDYCWFCGEPVLKNSWREHMRDTHHAVLKEDPNGGEGDWMPVEVDD